MRISRLAVLAVLAALALAPAANAMTQDVRSGDARDADAAPHAQTLQDIVAQHARNDSALAQERYYSSYGEATPVRHAADDDSPWLVVGIGLGLIVLAAGSVAVAVHTRRRTARVRLAV